MPSRIDANALVNFCRMIAFAPDSELQLILSDDYKDDLIPTLNELQELRLLVTAVTTRISEVTGLHISAVPPTLH